jgi:hypothetical protein
MATILIKPGYKLFSIWVRRPKQTIVSTEIPKIAQ